MPTVKTAVSIPEDLFRRLEEIAGQRCTSRSKILAEALADYVTRIDREELTRRFNEALATMTDEEREEDMRFLDGARRRRLQVAEATGDTWDAPAR
ncbi:MAG: ribbon-helix-helix protein, CopG family [Dehalococcoidia bacterium]